MDSVHRIPGRFGRARLGEGPRCGGKLKGEEGATYEILPIRPNGFHPDTSRLIKTPMTTAGTVNILIRDRSVSDKVVWESYVCGILEPVLIPGLRENVSLAKINLIG